jgi:hypothetical protein
MRCILHSSLQLAHGRWSNSNITGACFVTSSPPSQPPSAAGPSPEPCHPSWTVGLDTDPAGRRRPLRGRRTHRRRCIATCRIPYSAPSIPQRRPRTSPSTSRTPRTSDPTPRHLPTHALYAGKAGEGNPSRTEMAGVVRLLRLKG